MTSLIVLHAAALIQRISKDLHAILSWRKPSGKGSWQSSTSLFFFLVARGQNFWLSIHECLSLHHLFSCCTMPQQVSCPRLPVRIHNIVRPTSSWLFLRRVQSEIVCFVEGDSRCSLPEGSWARQFGHSGGSDGIWRRIWRRDPRCRGRQNSIHQRGHQLHCSTPTSTIKSRVIIDLIITSCLFQFYLGMLLSKPSDLKSAQSDKNQHLNLRKPVQYQENQLPVIH